MADDKRKRAKVPSNAAAVSVNTALDTRRVLPTQDWVTKVDAAQLDAVANIQKLAVSHFYTGLVNLRKDFAGQVLFPPDQNQFPRELHGTVALPGGQPAAALVVSILPFVDASNNATVNFTQTGITDDHGQFSIRNLPSAFVRSNTSISLQFRGSNGTETKQFAASQIGPLGIVGNVTLALALTPLPQSIVASLAGLVGSLDEVLPAPPRPGTTDNPISVKLGGCECPIHFERDLPEERFRYSMLVRLVEPRTSILTQTIIFRGVKDNIYFSALRNSAWSAIPNTQSTFVERVPVDQPISVDGFRDRIVGIENGVISEAETVPMAGTLGLGYVLQMAQQWKSKGLSLGDLVYSLPLAPGEQQRVAVFEQRQTLSTVELETLDYDEQQQASQQSDSSTQAVFNSGFAEHVRGASSFTTQADSSSWGVAGGVGAILGPVAIGIGAGGGGGSSSSSGSSSNSLDGTRDYVSTAASQAHNSIERQASARRHAQRTGMRLATASDTEQVTTKVITNNNRMHALTMQYWEVLRHFEVSTAIDGVTLVCFVPLEVVRFVPPGASVNLIETDVSTRAQVLFRYSQIIKHADILRRWIPFQYRQGLAILEEFASNPRALPAFASATEDIITISLRGSFLPMEDVYVSVLTRRGTRLGPVRMNGPVPALPDTVTDPAHAFQTKAQLVGELIRRRGPDQDITITSNITLPSSVNPDDVVGFELSRNFRTLTYQLVPPAADPIQTLLGGNLNTNSPFLVTLLDRIDATLNGVTMTPDQLEQELGGPSVWGFSAGIVGPPVETYASGFIGRAERLELPANGYPIAAQAVAPLLKFNQLLRIEQVLQHVMRNTITYSRAVWSSLTPEERAIMLEGFTIGVPADGIPDPTQHVPLLNCVANQLLGFYGNSMIMPFNIPAEVATRMTVGTTDQKRPFTTSEVQNALTQFHRAGFSPPVSNITLPTHGVLGEAVLGTCPSAEKIDLTRFWNWQDSPLPQAADIAGTTLNKGSTLIGATAPSTLTGLPSIVQNVNAPAADANAALQALIAGQNTKDVPNITGIDQLAALQGKTLDTAEKARADALARAQTLATEGLNKAGDIMKARADSQRADQQAQQQQQTQAQTKANQQSQQAVTTMRTNASNYLSVADSRPDQASANAYAAQIVQQLFGGQTVPLETASSLFNNYRKFQSGTSGPLTQGSTSFLTALGLL
jgi:hypothetical protein